MRILLVFVLFTLVITMEFLDGVRPMEVQRGNDTEYLTVFRTLSIAPRCGPGERPDRFGVCRYVYD